MGVRDPLLDDCKAHTPGSRWVLMDRGLDGPHQQRGGLSSPCTSTGNACRTQGDGTRSDGQGAPAVTAASVLGDARGEGRTPPADPSSSARCQICVPTRRERTARQRSAATHLEPYSQVLLLQVGGARREEGGLRGSGSSVA